MKFTYLAAGAVALALSGGAANAALTTYHFNDSLSSIVLSQTSGGCLGPCDLNAAFHGPFTWSTDTSGDTHTESDFIDWSVTGGTVPFLGYVTGIGGKTYDVSLTLAFDQPGSATGGSGGDVSFFTVFGALSGGALSWDGGGAGLIDFGGGTQIAYDLFDSFQVGTGYTAYTGAKFTSVIPAAVPLPAGGLLLLGGLGGLAALRRRRKAA